MSEEPGIDQAQKEQAIAAVLKRATIAKTARLLKQRLALAAYKAQHGLQASTFDQIEPRADDQVKKRKARASQDLTQQSAKRQALARIAAVPSDPLTTHPYPPQMSLYDAMMTPNLNSSIYGSFSPRLDEAFTTNPPLTSQASPSRIKTVLQIDPSVGLPHPSSPVSSAREETPFNRPQSPEHRPRTQSSPSSLHRRTGSLPAHHSNTKPISSSDPNFRGSAKEFVQAASALTSFTTASESTIPANAPSGHITPPPADIFPAAKPENKSPRSTSAPTFSRSRSKTGPDSETAAELMLYLASSPSPQGKKSSEPLTGQDQMKGRRLFAEEENPAATGRFPSQRSEHSPPALKTPGVLPPASRPQSVPATNDQQQTQPNRHSSQPYYHPAMPGPSRQPHQPHDTLAGSAVSQSQPSLNHSLPSYSSADFHQQQPMFYGHSSLPPSFQMNNSYPNSSYSPLPDVKSLAPDQQMYYQHPVSVHQPPRPAQFDVSLYMSGQQAPSNFAAMPAYPSEPYGSAAW